jgi:hypothetical protein
LTIGAMDGILLVIRQLPRVDNYVNKNADDGHYFRRDDAYD